MSGTGSLQILSRTPAPILPCSFPLPGRWGHLYFKHQSSDLLATSVGFEDWRGYYVYHIKLWPTNFYCSGLPPMSRKFIEI